MDRTSASYPPPFAGRCQAACRKGSGWCLLPVFRHGILTPLAGYRRPIGRRYGVRRRYDRCDAAPRLSSPARFSRCAGEFLSARNGDRREVPGDGGPWCSQRAHERLLRPVGDTARRRSHQDISQNRHFHPHLCADLLPSTPNFENASCEALVNSTRKSCTICTREGV